MKEEYRACRLCPRRCGVNRAEGKVGVCGATSGVLCARAALHYYEEPCISGAKGSGAVFFSHCPLHCVFCQNGEISRGGAGYGVTSARLSEIYLELQAQGANNINLVTACHYAPDVAESLRLAKSGGLHIPVVYNSSGYESVQTLKMFTGLVNIYLPDMKYCAEKYAVRYSAAPGYFETAKEAIAEMFGQVGRPVFDSRGMLLSGVIVRHLMLPRLLFDSKKIIDYLFSAYGSDILISIMNQYTPHGDLSAYPSLQAPLYPGHYSALTEYASGIGVKNGYVQEGGTVSESFIPAFNGAGVVHRQKRLKNLLKKQLETVDKKRSM